MEEDSIVCYADGVHPTHNSHSTYAWIEKEENQTILIQTLIYIGGVYDKLTNEVKVSESKHLKDKDNRTILEELHSATFNGKILNGTEITWPL